MNFENLIEDNLLIICDNEIKNKILSHLNDISDIYNIKFMNINEIIKKIFFDYDRQAIYYLMNKYNIPYEISEMYIKNMYFVEDKNYKNEKLNKLVRYKKELDSNDLLIKDSLFIDYIKKFKIKVCMKKITKYQMYILDILKKYTSVSICDFEYKEYNHKVYEFKTIDDEIEFVANNICNLIEHGVSINNIKISNIDDEYIYPIKRIFGFYNIPINLKNNSYLIGTKIGKEFIENLNSDINKTIKLLEKYQSNPIYDLIIEICNKYTFVDDFLKVKDLLMHDLQTTLVPKNKYDNAIEVVDYKNIVDDDYIFLMNFNLNSVPKVYKDEDYITDNVKPDYLDSTNEKNKLEKEITIKSIRGIKNLFITFKDVTPTSECYPSNLIEEFEVEKKDIDIYKSYSKINDELKLASYLDKLLKYGYQDEKLNALKYNYDIPYMKYDNKYKKVNIDSLNKIIDNKLSLSYSKIEEYNECPFKYYLSKVLKLDIYEENFAAILGTIFHHVLEIGINHEIDVDKEVDGFIKENYKNKEFSNMEKFFINKAKENMKFSLNTIKYQMKYCKLNNVLTEKKVYISKDKNLKITFSGIIDKLLYNDEKENTIVAIIDYKTGNNIDIDLGYMKYGIGLQLPIYIYLADNMGFRNIRFAGIYLQKIMPDIEKKDENREDKLKLEGYSNSNKDIIEKFDSSYENSKFIKGLRTKSDGEFYSNSKVLDDNSFSSLSSFASKQVDNAISNILDAKFDISPIKKDTDSDVTACKYCKYKDICFRTNDDIRNLKKDNDLSFLGGDINA